MDKTVNVEKQSQVSEQMGGLEDGIGDLSESIKRLENKLEGVLVSPPPTEEEGKDQVALTPLAEKLRGFRMRVTNIDSSVNDIIKRLEL